MLSERFLKERSSNSYGTVNLQEEDIEIFAKIIRTETLLEFTESHLPSALGLIHTLKFELMEIEKKYLQSYERTDDIQF